jgi:DNA-binding response OmpR family regulator
MTTETPPERNIIVVMDDDSSVRTSTAYFAPQVTTGKTVESFVDARAAVEYLQGEFGDRVLLVISDFNTPRGDGNDVVAAARAAQVPHIIGMSTNTDQFDDNSIALLQKVFTLDELEMRLKEVLGISE